MQTGNSSRSFSLNGFYRGRVIKHVDNGKVKVYVPGVYPEEYKTDWKRLPDAELAHSLDNAGVGAEGALSYPTIGSIVWCFFANNDQNYPVVFACHVQGSILSSAYDADSFYSLGNSYENVKYDYRKHNPVTSTINGKTFVKTNADGFIDVLAARHLNHATDCPQQKYSSTMRLLNYMKSVGLVGNNNYFVYIRDENNSGTITIVPISHSSSDDDANWYADFPDDKQNIGKCIGLSCVLDSKQDDKSYMLGAGKLSCPIVGIVSPKADFRLLYHTQQSPAKYDRSSGIKNVFICADGSEKYVKQAAETKSDLYICNGAQYKQDPQYWDKHFFGSYPAQCPINTIPPKVLPDAKKYDINIYLVDPYEVCSGLKNNAIDGFALETLDLEHEFEYKTSAQPNGVVKTTMFKQNALGSPVEQTERIVQCPISSYVKVEDVDVLSSMTHTTERKMYAYNAESGQMENSYRLCNDDPKNMSLSALAVSAVFLDTDSEVREDFDNGIEKDVGPKKEESLHLLSASSEHGVNVNLDYYDIFGPGSYVHGVSATLSANLNIGKSHLQHKIVDTNKAFPVPRVYGFDADPNECKMEISAFGKQSNMTICPMQGIPTVQIDTAAPGFMDVMCKEHIKIVVGSTIIEIDKTGKIDITANNCVNINSPQVTMNGDLNVEGNVTVQGTVSDGGCTLASHTHTVVDTMSGFVGSTTTGVG